VRATAAMAGNAYNTSVCTTPQLRAHRHTAAEVKVLEERPPPSHHPTTPGDTMLLLLLYDFGGGYATVSHGTRKTERRRWSQTGAQSMKRHRRRRCRLYSYKTTKNRVTGILSFRLINYFPILYFVYYQ